MESFRKDLREAYREWLTDLVPEESIAITITFNRKILDEAARQAVRIYCAMLNSKAFGRRYKRRERRLTFIPVREGGTAPQDKHLHYHLLVEVPEGWSTGDWIRLAKEKLKTIECFGDQCRIRSVWDQGWLEYILKDRDKKSFSDAVDVENLWVS